ncbi:MAG: glycoside hydrolase family 47 protein [Calditrichaeota bacterium]|nr:glycoside hydrolase family 47 protein [Calditrichota bacterium]
MKILFITFLLILFWGCSGQNDNQNTQAAASLAQQVKQEAKRSWDAYKKYAWGHDVLLPISKSYKDWYEQSLHISPIDAYSTIKLMGLEDDAKYIENYVSDSISFNKDIYVKVFEVNIRILGGLLAMYEQTENPKVLKQAEDFGNRMLKAFDSKTGIPYYWVNLKTGAVKGDTINVAEAGSYTFEMGILSYYTQNPVYYQAAKKATKAVFDRRSEIGLIGEIINVNTGEWVVSNDTHIGAGVDSYYEYMYKSVLMFGDPEMQEVWNASIAAIEKYIPEEFEGRLWYGHVDKDSGKKTTPQVTLYDAFFPAILAVSGHLSQAERLQQTWDWLWNQYGLEPMVYNYKEKKATYPVYDLNPEIIESAYYLYHFTKDEKYRKMAEKYWQDILKYCRTDVAFTQVKDVQTMEQNDYMATFFFAETLKYFYLIFSSPETFDFDNHVFSTEAHPFQRDKFQPDQVKIRLGI